MQVSVLTASMRVMHFAAPFDPFKFQHQTLYSRYNKEANISSEIFMYMRKPVVNLPKEVVLN